MRHSATRSLLERRDVIVVASVRSYPLPLRSIYLACSRSSRHVYCRVAVTPADVLLYCVQSEETTPGDWAVAFLAFSYPCGDAVIDLKMLPFVPQGCCQFFENAVISSTILPFSDDAEICSAMLPFLRECRHLYQFRCF